MRTKTDRLIMNMAKAREFDLAKRRNREPKLPNGVGQVCTGSIFDVDRKGFERALKAYWDKLFVGWNPWKNEGRGCWEVWQKPVHQTDVFAYEDENSGKKVYSLEYIYSDYLHWVADLDFLNYNFINRLREMDAWENKHLLQQHDDAYEAHFEKLEREEDENIKYVVKHNKKVFRDLLDYVQQGYNPLDFFKK